MTASPARPTSRRRFLAVVALAGLGLAAGAVGWKRRQLLLWLAKPAIAPAPRGPLAEGTRAVLVATARTLLGDPITDATYADFFAWRAENVPGLRALYDGFARWANGAARRAGARDFASADVAVRRRVLRALAPRRGWRRVVAGVAERDALRWSQQVEHEIRKLFLRTDVWRRLGYDRVPGEPSGLAGLDAPPAGAA